MLRNYTNSFSDTELDFFKFHKREKGGGYPGQGIFTPHSLFLTDHIRCYLDGENKVVILSDWPHNMLLRRRK